MVKHFSRSSEKETGAMKKNAEEKSYVLLTTVGTDHPGIVEEISKWILDQGGNIEDSRMALLGGEFATLILVSGDSRIFDRIRESRNALQSKHDLIIFTKPVSRYPQLPEKPTLRYYLQATSIDHPGIVYHVARILHRSNVNIVSAQTQKAPAPFSGALAFLLEMEIDIPSDVNINKLRDSLRALGDKENIDFELTAE